MHVSADLAPCLQTSLPPRALDDHKAHDDHRASGSTRCSTILSESTQRPRSHPIAQTCPSTSKIGEPSQKIASLIKLWGSLKSVEQA